MEEDINQRLTSPLARTKTMVKVEDRLEAVVNAAEERMKYESAHDEQLLGALDVVADFIQRKKRVCYGGTAMNELLPDSKKFYDPRVDLPDYDFYTPDVKADISDLVDDLKVAGYRDVYHKVGIHEGTYKILVNFVPVADVSAIDSELFTALLRRSVLKNGIHYTDPDVLRMMMFLELSRPKGMVSRWKKVFERLQLINQLLPIKGCKGQAEASVPSIPTNLRKIILTYCIARKRTLCNGALAALYERGIRGKRTIFKVGQGGAVLLTSPDPKGDATALKAALAADDIRMYLHEARGEIVPKRVELRQGNTPLCMFVEETACHSYNTLKLAGGSTIRIASLEFLVTLHLSMDIFTHNSRDYLGNAGLCSVKHFIELYEKNYSAVKSIFPPFASKCEGHQVGFPSLMRKKVERIKQERGGEKTRRKSSKTKSARKSTRKES